MEVTPALPLNSSSSSSLNVCPHLQENFYLKNLIQQQRHNMYTRGYTSGVPVEAPGCPPDTAGIPPEAPGAPWVHPGTPVNTTSVNHGYKSLSHGWRSGNPGFPSVPRGYSPRYPGPPSGTLGYSSSPTIPTGPSLLPSGSLEYPSQSHELSVRGTEVLRGKTASSPQLDANSEFWKARTSHNSFVQSGPSELEYFQSQKPLAEYSRNVEEQYKKQVEPSSCYFQKPLLPSSHPTHTQHWYATQGNYPPYPQQQLMQGPYYPSQYQQQATQYPPPQSHIQQIPQENRSPFQRHPAEPPLYPTEFQQQPTKQHFQQQPDNLPRPSQLQQNSMEYPFCLPQYQQIPLDEAPLSSKYQQPNLKSPLQPVQTKLMENPPRPLPILEKLQEPPHYPPHCRDELIKYSSYGAEFSSSPQFNKQHFSRIEKATEISNLQSESVQRKRMISHMKWINNNNNNNNAFQQKHDIQTNTQERHLMQSQKQRKKKPTALKKVPCSTSHDQGNQCEVQVLPQPTKRDEKHEKEQQSSTRSEDGKSHKNREVTHPKDQQLEVHQGYKNNNSHLNLRTEQALELLSGNNRIRIQNYQTQNISQKQSSPNLRDLLTSGEATDQQRTPQVKDSQPQEKALDNQINQSANTATESQRNLSENTPQVINQLAVVDTSTASQTRLAHKVQQCKNDQQGSEATRGEKEQSFTHKTLKSKYMRDRGKFARMLGSDSPPPVFKRPRYSSSCMHDTLGSSVDDSLSALETSLDSFVKRKTVIARNHYSVSSTDSNVTKYSNNSPQSALSLPSSPIGVIYSGSIQPITDSRNSNANSSLETSITKRDGSCIADHDVNKHTRLNAEPNHTDIDTDKNSISSTSCNLTPPPTPPTCSLSPKTNKMSVIPAITLDNRTPTPTCRQDISEELEDTKPVTFTSSFLEPPPPVQGEETITLQAATTSVTPDQLETSAAVPRVSPDLPIPSSGPHQVSSMPTFRTVQHNTSSNFPKPAKITKYSETIRHLISSKMASFKISKAVKQSEDIQTQPERSNNSSACKPSLQARTPRKDTTHWEKQKKRNQRGSSKYNFNVNFCIQGRFSVYIPPQLELPCIMCGVMAAGEEALYHLFFGQVKCVDCEFCIHSCEEFKTLKPLEVVILREECGENHNLQWSSNPVDFVTYHMTKILAMQDRNTAKDCSPSITSVIDEMDKFLHSFSVLKDHSPWREAICRCRKYVKNMKSTSDLTPRMKPSRRRSDESNSEHATDSCSSKEGSPEAAREVNESYDSDDKNKKLPLPSTEKTNEPEMDNRKQETKRREDGSSTPPSPSQTSTATDHVAEKMPRKNTEMKEKDAMNSGVQESSSSINMQSTDMPSKNLHDAESTESSHSTSESASKCAEESPSGDSNQVPSEGDVGGTTTSPIKDLQENTQVTEPQNSSSNVEKLNSPQDDFERPLVEECMMSPEFDSGFGDLLLSQSYTNDMLEGIIQCVAVGDERMKNATDEDMWASCPYTRQEPDNDNTPDIRDSNSEAPESADVATPSLEEVTPEALSSSPPTESVPREPAPRTEYKKPSHSTPKGKRYMPMPKSKRKSLYRSESKDQLQAPSSDLGSPPPLTRLPQPPGVDIKAHGDNYVMYSNPSKLCPEECPVCYLNICPTNFYINVVTYMITYKCCGCGLFIYISQEVEKMLGYRRKPGPKSKAMKFLLKD